MERSVDLTQGSTLARQIRDVLMDRILSGELKPGARLKDNEVAASFRASNTPVREALRMLAQEGLVDVVPYRGCVVRSVDAESLAELLDVRTALEAFAARTVAPRLSAEQLRALEAIVDAYDQAYAAGDWARANDADSGFHRLLGEATGNRTLIRGLQQIANRLHVVRRIYVRELSPVANPSCRAILEALQARDGERAAALITEHFARAKQRVCEVLEAAGETKA